MTWDELLAELDLERPARERESGGYVPALLRNGRRRREDVEARSVLTLDADAAQPSLLADVAAALPGVAFAAHTTWSHGVKGERWRLLAPLSRDLDADAYHRLARAVRDALGDHWGGDNGCPEPERFMYRPATQGEYLHHVQPGGLLDVDAWLADEPERVEQRVEHTEPRELHPYAAAAVERELTRLDRCDPLVWDGVTGWNNTTYEVACTLVEFANSPWSGYSLDDAHDDLLKRAPTDPGFGPPEHEGRWRSAMQKVGTKSRPHPDGDAADDFAEPLAGAEPSADRSFEEAVARRVRETLIEDEVRRRVAEHKSLASGVQRLGAVDLSLVLDPSYEEPRPDVLRLDETGVCLLERGATHSINGESGAGKSWLALLGVQQELDAGRHVVYIDCEDDEGRIVGRLLALGVDRDAIRERFSYRRPFGAWTEGDVMELVRYLRQHAVSLVVFDGVTDALAMHGLSSNADTEVAVLFSTFGGRLAAAGPAVVFVDHITNEAADSGTATRGRGSGFKIGGLSGTALFVDTHTQMGRGLVGASHVAIGRKVRGGWLQEHSVDGPAHNKRRVALLEVDAVDQPSVAARLLPPIAKGERGGGREFAAAAADERIVEGIRGVLAGEKGPRSKNWIVSAYRQAGHTGGQGAVYRVVDYMAENGDLDREPKGWKLP